VILLTSLPASYHVCKKIKREGREMKAGGKEKKKKKRKGKENGN
jgi:hypothetical protein